MKAVRLSLVIMTAALLTLGVSGLAFAFHSGGVAECEGCHSMHSSPSAAIGFLLVGATQTETCLECHQGHGDTGPSSYHISSASDMGSGPPLQRTPGGDFAWLQKTYSWGTGTGDIEHGYTHGHNIIAPSKGYNVDPENATAPGGGSFPAAQLACNSCHDPHGKYRRNAAGTISTTGGAIWASGSYPGTGNEPRTVGTENLSVGVYRLLAGMGYAKDGVTFPGNPAAKVPSTYNRTEASTQTRVAYGRATTGGHVAWGTWCATCHPNMHSVTGGGYTHPTDIALGGDVAGNYQAYVKSGDMTGAATASYLSIVPFITNSADYTALGALAVNNDTQLAGPGANDQVSCLSCHRTHASAWPHMLRFSYGYEFVTKNGEYVATDNPDFPNWGSRRFAQAQGRTIADMTAGYYGRAASRWSAYQRVLCNKCHAKD